MRDSRVKYETHFRFVHSVLATLFISGAAVHPNDLASWTLHGNTYSQPTDWMVAEAGYPVESHDVVTEDGYILTLHRLPQHRPGVESEVVFLQHGLMSSSADWVLAGPHHALAYQLWDAGYDVWLGNFRGNTYSRGHLNQTMEERIYWRFTWDEHAQYDLPAMLRHVMEVSGAEDYFYIGHSMGTLSYFTACNYNAWLCNKTRLMVGYGPHTSVPHLSSPLFRFLARFSGSIHWLLQEIGMYEFMPSSWLVHALAEKVCDRVKYGEELCENMLFSIGGYDLAEMNATLVPFIVGHTPAGTSSLNMIHYAQSVRGGPWAGYDWGSADLNMARWNSPTPPLYTYTNITSPVALYWADNDILVVPQDVRSLASSLPNLVSFTGDLSFREGFKYLCY